MVLDRFWIRRLIRKCIKVIVYLMGILIVVSVVGNVDYC